MASDDERDMDEWFDELVRYLDDVLQDTPPEDVEERSGFSYARHHVRKFQLSHIKDVSCSCDGGVGFPKAYVDDIWRCADCGDTIYKEDRHVEQP